MQISDVANRIEPSKGRALFNMAAQYSDAINLTLGDPDFCPPLSVREAACVAIMNGNTHYSANAGLLELRNIYCDFLYKRYQRCFDPQTEVIVTVGGMEALYLTLIATINPGDEVIIFAPFYINYYQMIQMCGGIPVVIDTNEENGFEPELDNLEKVITDRTRAIIINSPTNPTGAVYSPSKVDGIISIAQRNECLLISDEVYRTLVFSEAVHYSVLQSNNPYDGIMFIDSCSKQFSMTGWRLGFAVGPAPVIQAMAKLQENVAACAPLPSQFAAIDAFKNMPDMRDYVEAFQSRRDFFIDRLNQIPKLSCRVPAGTFYAFVNIRETGMKSQDFALKLLESKQVALVPGIAYGDSFDDYVRIAFTLEQRRLGEALDRIGQFIEELPEK